MIIIIDTALEFRRHRFSHCINSSAGFPSSIYPTPPHPPVSLPPPTSFLCLLDTPRSTIPFIHDPLSVRLTTSVSIAQTLIRKSVLMSRALFHRCSWRDAPSPPFSSLPSPPHPARRFYREKTTPYPYKDFDCHRKYLPKNNYGCRVPVDSTPSLQRLEGSRNIVVSFISYKIA